ncbi:MAG TPA: shikimate kinase [Pyrinomonadaceae bacterium]|jgi:shikimate kinase|nr:shikimate kinase [Pyrinomonadaceae bacterium]
MNEEKRVILTGFMGVGKSTVAKHLAHLLECQRIDLDSMIVESEHRTIAEIIEQEGIEQFRRIETATLRRILEAEAKIIALGGGAWTIEENRRLIKSHNFTTVWLESTFEHCWLNISASKRVRPLARNKSDALKLFEERQRVYCLADWHFIIKPELNSFEIAKQIAEEVFSFNVN